MDDLNLGWLLFSFQGRINRAKYWLAILIFFIIGIVAGIVGFVSGHNLGFQIFNAVVEIALFISGLAVGAKRLHDHEKSAWWLLLFSFAPALFIILGVVLRISSGSWAAMAVFAIAAFAIGIWSFVLLGCLRGTVGPNDYGPDPVAAA
jgi:uncharacterized membrane protein YhaH (DUF805 family)